MLDYEEKACAPPAKKCVFRVPVSLIHFRAGRRRRRRRGTDESGNPPDSTECKTLAQARRICMRGGGQQGGGGGGGKVCLGANCAGTQRPREVTFEDRLASAGYIPRQRWWSGTRSTDAGVGELSRHPEHAPRRVEILGPLPRAAAQVRTCTGPRGGGTSHREFPCWRRGGRGGGVPTASVCVVRSVWLSFGMLRAN